MKITNDLLSELVKHDMRSDSSTIDKLREQEGVEIDHAELVKQLIAANDHNWAALLVTTVLTHINRVRFALFAAEIVAPICNAAKYKFVDNAVCATRDYLANPCKKTSEAAEWAGNCAVSRLSPGYAQKKILHTACAAGLAAKSAAGVDSDVMRDISIWNSFRAAKTASFVLWIDGGKEAKIATYEKIIEFGLELIESQI